MLVRSDIYAIGHSNANQGTFKNCGAFIKRITIIDGTTIYDAENLDLIMLIYNLLEYSSNFYPTTDGLWFMDYGLWFIKQYMVLF